MKPSASGTTSAAKAPFRRSRLKKKLSPERAVSIALGVCAALDYIHTHGVVHRDLKPENVMVDRQNRIKLSHFGIAAKPGAGRTSSLS